MPLVSWWYRKFPRIIDRTNETGGFARRRSTPEAAKQQEDIVMETTTDNHNPKEDDTPSEQPQSSAPQLATVEIDPRRCWFDRHLSSTPAANLERMERKYGLFVPDREYLTDLAGLLGYGHEKIQLGHVCLFCQRRFATATACQKHMVHRAHTKLRYEAGVDLDEWDVFYDFGAADAAFWGDTAEATAGGSAAAAAANGGGGKEEDAVMQESNDNDDDDDEWEDISEDEAEVSDDDDDETTWTKTAKMRMKICTRATKPRWRAWAWT